MKLGLSVTLLASIVIFIFSSFSGQLGWWFKYPDCNPRVIQNSQSSLYNTTTKEEDYYLKTNISHVLFGIGGSVKTWKNRRQYNELWWKQNVTRGFVWLDENPDANEPWIKTSPPYKVSKRSSKSAARIARIVLESFQLGLENVRWFVMGDDDTVFFTDNLVTVLSKYDHNEMYYIGEISESIEQNLLHSYGMAFGGGGGFAISYPLAQVLFETLDGCLDRYEDLYGSDERIHSCLAEIGVPLTIEVGFHQIDIRGDPYGLLAAHPLTPLVSLHHLDDVKSLFPNMSQLESMRLLVGAYEMDPGRALQQSFCYDLKRNWTVSVSWGYTSQIYPYLLTAKEMWTPLRTFQTWRSWSDGPFSFNTKSRDLFDRCRAPLIYFLVDGKIIQVNGEDNSTVTTYKRFESETKCEKPENVSATVVQTITVSASKMEENEWEKGPRRQCCEVVHDGSDDEKEQLRIKIRRCYQMESLTPR